MNARLFRLMSAGALLALSVGSAIPARADTVGPIDFESYSYGTINAQDGWSRTGSYDHNVADPTTFWAVPGFGTHSLRMSNASTSGSFSDHTFSKPLLNEAGESTARNDGFSLGPRQTRFDTSWEFASAVPLSEQQGLDVVASPNRGDVGRMSWVQMKDTPAGLEINFFDYQDLPPYGSNLTPADGCTSPPDDFVPTTLATGLARNVKHSIRLVMDFVDGPRNDIVRVYVDGVLKHVGTSWEDYFVFCAESAEGRPLPDASRTVDSILFATRGTAAPATLGKGFLIDNLVLVSSIPPLCTTDCYVDDATGNDAFGGASAADAKKTIQAAINQVSVGGTVHVAAGTYNEDVSANKANVTLQGAGIDVSTIVGPIGGVGGSTIAVGAAGVVIDGFTVTRAGNNPADWNLALNNAGVSVQSQGNTVELRNSKLTGNRTGIDINDSNGNSIHNNIIDNNRTGMIFRNQTDNTSVVNNFITNNWTVGIVFLDASGGTNSPVQTALNSTFSNNSISGNWYGQIIDRQTGGSLPAPGANLKNFSGNWYGTTAPIYSTANSTEPGYAAQIPVIYGGAAVPPGGQPDILGPASANFDFTPYLGLSTDTALAIAGFQGDFSSLYVTAAAGQTGVTARVQEGVDAVTPAGTVRVVAGAYTGATTIGKTLNLFGAKQGVAVSGRTSGGPAESTVSGLMLLNAANIAVDGFSIKNPLGLQVMAIKTAGSGASVRYNFIDTAGNPASGPGQGVYLENGPDNVDILNNAISAINSLQSASGILIGDSAATNPSTNVRVEGNTIRTISSVTRGAYGLISNNPTGALALIVRNNVIDGLAGGAPSGWAMGVSLSANTPNAQIDHNVIRNMTAPAYTIGVYFEANPGIATSQVNRNSLSGSTGLFVFPTPAPGTLDGACNWWGDPTGPSGGGAGYGVPVGAGITFSPWLGTSALDGACPAADLFFNPAAAMVASGANLGVDLNIGAVSNLYGYEFRVVYPAAMGSATGSFVNSFFDTTSNVTIPGGWNAACSAGECKFAVSKQAPGGAAVSGPGTLGHIVFTGATPGVYTVTYQGALMSDPDPTSIPVITRTAVITVYGQATVSGIVKLQGRATPITAGPVTLVDTTGLFVGPYATTYDASLGTFSLNVPALAAGTTYTLTADHDLYLGRYKLLTVMPGNTYAQPTTTLRGGDANNDERVAIGDLTCIGNTFGTAVPTCAGGSSDINADGIVNVFDLVIAGGNFDLPGPGPGPSGPLPW